MRKPERPPAMRDLMEALSSEKLVEIMMVVTEPTYEGKYLHWDDIRHRPAPAGLSTEQWWLGLKWSRMQQAKQIPLTDMAGKAFTFMIPETAHALLHAITQRASGSIGASDQVTNPETRNRYLIRNLMEEGITSSLIEGAATTREKAKEMLRSKREPRDEGEQMVVNNYAAMQRIISLGQAPLTHEIVFELHEMITRETLKDPTAAGRFRRPDEHVDVIDTYGNVMHDPPPAEQLPERFTAMCKFANGETPEGFVHPVVRSILLHFWLAYDHPFKDGNGRTARALFYWSMIQNDYWLCQFISISQIIHKAAIQYGRAFLHTETDGNDLTYFVLHQLDVIKKAIDELHRYIDSKVEQRRRLETRLRLGSALNDRQLDLVAHALRHPDAQYDIQRHQNNHFVVYQTARTDLLDLVDKGFLTKRKMGRTWYFHPVLDLEGKLKTYGRQRSRH